MQTAESKLDLVIVENGRDAIKAWKKSSFDLILMDIQMPYLDGYEVTRLIRAQEEGAGEHIPIIALSAHASEESQKIALRAGMDDYLVKPLRLEKIYETVARYVKTDGEKPD